MVACSRWGPFENLILQFSQNMAYYMFLESSCQGLSNNMLHFEFREKIYELSSNKGFKLPYYITYNSVRAHIHHY
jgi:hypothetical protein